MDRRNFLKITCAGFAAGIIPSAAAKAMELPQRISGARWRVSVVRKHCFADLQSCFLDDPDSGVCPLVDDSFCGEFILAGEMPRSLAGKFCPKAWRALADAASGSSGCAQTLPQAILASCGDATRPVVFKLEKA